jgi:hypothetical protein
VGWWGPVVVSGEVEKLWGDDTDRCRCVGVIFRSSSVSTAAWRGLKQVVIGADAGQ